MAKRQLSLADFRIEVPTSPALLAHNVDFGRRAMLFIRLTEQDYRRASFLDDRILTTETEGAWIRLDAALPAIAEIRPAASLHYIFHSGHVGSTLLSRLLDGAPGVMGLREPLILRTLAGAQDDLPQHGIDPATLNQLIGSQSILWRRAFPDVNQTIVKATSSAVRLGARLLDATASAKAVCLNVDLETYLATLLAGELSPIDLERHRSERQRRLATFLGDTPVTQSLGEEAAFAWVTESLSQAELIGAYGDRILQVNFDALLKDIAGTLRAVATHFDLAAPPDFFAHAPQSAVMRSYAKAPEAPYSPLVRAQTLAEARARFANEITQGLRWVERLAGRSPAVAALRQRA